MNQENLQERAFCALPYLLPLAAAIPIGVYLFRELDFLIPVFLPLIWLHQLLNFPIVPFIGISLDTVLFFVLYGLVVQDTRFSRTIRVNVMQALLLSIVLFISTLLLRFVSVSGVPLLGEVLSNTTFLGIVGASGYGIYGGLKSTVSELPGISGAAQMQVR